MSRCASWRTGCAPLGQTIVIENVAGAGGSIVARGPAAPDGCTISAGNWASHVATVAIYPLLFDLLKDLEPRLVAAQ